MDYGINRKIAWLLIIVLALTLVGCGGNVEAPVINGWQQPAGVRSAYIVQKGDTLYSIAWAFGMDYRDVARINNIPYPYRIHRGQRLLMSYRGGRRQTRSYRVATRRERYLPFVDKTKYKSVHCWLWPASGKVMKTFSRKVGGDKGIDIAGQYGTPVRASAAGLVVYSGSGLRAYGKLIIIKHNASYLSAYAYNRRILVHQGQMVKAGAKIATMGRNNSGKASLHFEIRHNGIPVNPLAYLRRGNR